MCTHVCSKQKVINLPLIIQYDVDFFPRKMEEKYVMHVRIPKGNSFSSSNFVSESYFTFLMNIVSAWWEKEGHGGDGGGNTNCKNSHWETHQKRSNKYMTKKWVYAECCWRGYTQQHQKW